MVENIPRQVIYSFIRKYNTSGTVGKKPRIGRPRRISAGQRTRLKRLVNYQTGTSWREIAQKFDVHRRTIQRN